MFANRSLKSKLFFCLFVFLVLPYLALNAVFYAAAESIIHEKIVNSTTKALKQTCLNIEGVVSSIVTGSNVIARTDWVAQSLASPPADALGRTRLQIEINTLFQSVQTNILPVESEILMVSAGGEIYSTALRDPDRADASLSSGWYSQTLERSYFYNWHQLHNRDLGLMGGENAEVIVMSRAVRDSSGKVCGVLAIAIDKRVFSEIFSNLASDRQESYIITEADGSIVLSSRQFSVSEAFAPYFQQILDRRSGSFSYYDSSDQYLVNFMSIDPLNWRIAVFSPHRYVFSEIDQLRTKTISLHILFLVPFSVIVIALFYRFLRPLSALMTLIHRVQKGDLSRRAPVTSKDELGVLTEHFNTMLDNVGRLIEENQQKQLRLAEQEKEKEAMRYLVLYSQINPHFLFNTLNNIKWMALINHDRVVADSISKLGHLLEASIRNTQDEITLREELSYLESYAHIMLLSQPGKFKLHFDVAPEVMECRILKLLLQPRVENSIIHGFQNKAENGEIIITAARCDGNLVIEVSDNGVGVQETELDGILSRKLPMNKLGVNNTNQRIRLYYGEQFGIQITPNTDGGTLVTVTLPFHIQKEEANSDV